MSDRESESVPSIRPCILCGKGVKCEPDYPLDIQVVCWQCIRAGLVRC